MTWLFKLKMNDMRQFKNYRFIGGGGVGADQCSPKDTVGYAFLTA